MSVSNTSVDKLVDDETAIAQARSSESVGGSYDSVGGSCDSVGGSYDSVRGSYDSGRWFSVLWPLAVLFHLAANPAHLLALRSVGQLLVSDGQFFFGDGQFPIVGLAQIPLVVAAVLVLVRPSAARALGLSGWYLVVLWLKLPAVGNHEVILGLVAGAVALSALRSLRRQHSEHSVGSSALDWVAGAAPTCRWILLISYSFIAFSKLNSGFFDPALSCAPVFVDEFAGLFGFGPQAFDRLDPVVIVAIAAIELVIPVLLVSSRWRSRGAVLGLVFHFVLALDPVGHVWDFSATLLPLFLLFMPSSFTDRLDRCLCAISDLLRGHGRKVPYLVVAVIVVAAATAVVGPVANWLVAYPLWLLVSAPIVSAALVSQTGGGPTLGRFGAARPIHPSAARPLGKPMVAIVVVAIAIGAGPYLQLRSSASFNMYSNLQITDGRSNHFIVPPLRSGSASNTEIAQAEPGSPLNYYVERGLAVPNENLTRYLRKHPDENPIIVVNLESGQGVQSGQGVDQAARSFGSPVAPVPANAVESLLDHLRYKLVFRRAVDLPNDQSGARYADSGQLAGSCRRAWGPLG